MDHYKKESKENCLAKIRSNEGLSLNQSHHNIRSLPEVPYRQPAIISPTNVIIDLNKLREQEREHEMRIQS